VNSHLVIQVTPTNDAQLTLLRSMEDTAVDFWKRPSSIGNAVQFRVDSLEYKEMIATLGAVHLDFEIVHSDVGKLIQDEQRNIALRRAVKSGKDFDFQNYHTLDEIVAHLDDVVQENPALVSKETISTTLEGRAVVKVTISTDLAANKPIMFYECGIHAREWISPATCLWVMNELVTGYGADQTITSYIDQFDWVFIPVTNPDGYVYTWGTNRLWRKNRKPVGACNGIDLNRNFGAGWGGSGSSNSACSETYRGTGAFSELETQGIRNYTESVRGRVKVAMSIHSYSQLWLSAYGYTMDLPDDFSEMDRAMEASIAAVTGTYGTEYSYGSTSNTLYVASGVGTDYYYDNIGVVHSYTVELRDTGRYGFELPPQFILPTATETWNGLKVLTDYIIQDL